MAVKLPEWNKWDDSVITDIHGDVRYYRDLYYGKHGGLFTRAKDLIENGEITDNLEKGLSKNPDGNVKTPYIVANACKIICKIPATMVSRAIGSMSLTEDQAFNNVEFLPTDLDPSGEGEKADNNLYLSDLLEDIETASGFKRGTHFSNILQQQIDGGLVGIPEIDDNGVRIVFKKREVYFPHEDNLGCDLAFKRSLEDLEGNMKEYLHVHRHRVEDNTLTIKQSLYLLNSGQAEEVEEEDAIQILEVDDLETVFPNRSKPLICYWGNEQTFDYPLGQSALFGQGSKQDEVNWGLTRMGMVYQRNGKPRMAITEKLMKALKNKAMDRYDDESLIDHRDLELVTMDEDGNSMQVIQIDIDKIGNIKWVKDILKIMFMETETSEKAVDYYLGESGSNAATSGVAKFYDLFTSILKAERLLGEYVDFIQELVENCFWLLSQTPEYSTIEVVRPSIQIKDIIPTSVKEKVETEKMAKDGGLRSTEKAVKNINEGDSDTAIEQELERIEGDQQSVNSNTGSMNSLNSLQSLLDNRSKDTGTAAAQNGNTEE